MDKQKESRSPESDSARSRWQWPCRSELLVILLFQLLFAYSFTLSSPVNGYVQAHRDGLTNGAEEIFDQDSSSIIDALVEERHFYWNPQHHLLYHFMTEGIYTKLLRPHIQHGPGTVYLFLKVFTMFTGFAFMVVVSRLLWEMGLALRSRILLLLLSGVSVTAWFNFSAFETHSLDVAGIALYVLVLLRIARSRNFGPRDQILLGVSLTFVVLCRLDLARFFVATALLILLAPYRAHWRRLGLVLASAFLVSCLLYAPMISFYFDVPLSETPKILLHRADSERLRQHVGNGGNLTVANATKMTLATTISTMIMPVGKEKFHDPLAGITSHPLAALTLTCYLAILIRVGYLTWKDRSDGGSFATAILLNWVVGLGLYTWFNPREPFIWLLEFLPLLIALLGNGLKHGGFRDWSLIGAGTLLVLLHNTVYFYLAYR